MIESESQLLLKQHQALLTGRFITDLANTSAFLFYHLPDINWVGFYLAKDSTLWLGPFQGKVACTEIPFDKGVCGHAATLKKSVIVADVHAFPGHIACDSASNSEIVIPLIKEGKVLGVLDVDSPIKNRFSMKEQIFLEEIVKQLIPSFSDACEY